MPAKQDRQEQDETLLQTKLFLPIPRHDLIQRQRLIDLLQSNLLHDGRFTRRLTLISAPAGYGKTTLASQWLASSEHPVSWLTLEAGENDPARFMAYFVAALQTMSPELGKPVQAMLQAPQRPPQEFILTALINDLAAHDGLLLIVLDDYHVIQSPPVHEALNNLLEHLPPNAHLVITSREDPPLPLHKLQARRQMLGLRQAELGFQVDEAVAYFQATSNIQLSYEQANKLTRRTEGWVTGLQLAALSMGSAEDQDTFIESFTGSNRYILDYLFEEVFEGQPVEIQDFLLKTATLNRISAGLANRLTARTDSQATLEKLEHANFFIVPLDHTRRWYRYHRLFMDLLRHRLNRSGFDQPALHELACRWFGEHGHLDEAIEHAIAGEHWTLAAEYLEQASEQKLRQGELATLLRWCRQLPEELLLSRPDWGLAYAWPLILIGEHQKAGRVLEHLKGIDPLEPIIRGQLAAAEAFLSRSAGDMQRTITLSKEALTLIPEDDRETRANISLNLGLITWHMGKLDEAGSALREALVSTKASGNHYAHHTALVFMARTLACRGDLNRATLQLEAAQKLGDRIPTAVLSYCDFAEILFIRDQVDAAWEQLRRAQIAGRTTGNQEFLTACYVQEALFHLRSDASEAANRALEPALGYIQSGDVPPLTLARIQSCQVQIALALGDLQRARELHAGIGIPHDAGTFTRFVDLNAVRIHLAEGDRDSAREAISALSKQAADCGWGYALQICNTLLALAEADTDRSMLHLQSVLEMGEAQGAIRIILSEGKAIVPLLHAAARRGIKPGYIGSILAAAGTSYHPEGLHEALSERELEVLRLVAAGLSNQQIADQIVVSVGTVKSHLHHIFGKLDVANRTEAVTRAQSLSLL